MSNKNSRDATPKAAAPSTTLSKEAPPFQVAELQCPHGCYLREDIDTDGETSGVYGVMMPDCPTHKNRMRFSFKKAKPANSSTEIDANKRHMIISDDATDEDLVPAVRLVPGTVPATANLSPAATMAAITRSLTTGSAASDPTPSLSLPPSPEPNCRTRSASPEAITPWYLNYRLRRSPSYYEWSLEQQYDCLGESQANYDEH